MVNLHKLWDTCWMSKQTQINTINCDWLNWKIDTHNMTNNQHGASNHQALRASIESHGVLTPLLCIEYDQKLWLLDGRQRWTIANQLGHKTVPITLLEQPSTNDPQIILSLLLALHASDIYQHPIHQCRLIQALSLPITPDCCQRIKLPLMNHIKTDIKRILALPEPVQTMLHCKQYSFKEVLHLIHYSPDLLAQLVTDTTEFSWSKRQLDQCMSQCCDLMKRHQWTLPQLLDQIQYKSIKTSQQSPQQRSSALFNRIQSNLTPTHQRMTDDIRTAINQLQHTTNIHIDYDHSFETSGITLSKTLQSSADIDAFCDQVQSPSSKEALSTILDML